MHGFDFIKVTSKYKNCPNCKSSYKDTKLKFNLKDEIITISCECGLLKKVDATGKEMIDKTKENEDEINNR